MTPETQKAIELKIKVDMMWDRIRQLTNKLSIEERQQSAYNSSFYKVEYSPIYRQREALEKDLFYADQELRQYCKGRHSIAKELREEICKMDAELARENAEFLREKEELKDYYDVDEYLEIEYDHDYGNRETLKTRDAAVGAVIFSIIWIFLWVYMLNPYLSSFWLLRILLVGLGVAWGFVCWIGIKHIIRSKKYNDAEHVLSMYRKELAEIEAKINKTSSATYKNSKERYQSIINLVEN